MPPLKAGLFAPQPKRRPQKPRMNYSVPPGPRISHPRLTMTAALLQAIAHLARAAWTTITRRPRSAIT